MEPGARKPASGFSRLLLTPFRARSHIAEKLGRGWAIAADVVILGGGLGLLAALVLDVPGEAKFGIFAGLFLLAAIAGVLIAVRPGRAAKRKPDTQP